MKLTLTILVLTFLVSLHALADEAKRVKSRGKIYRENGVWFFLPDASGEDTKPQPFELPGFSPAKTLKGFTADQLYVKLDGTTTPCGEARRCLNVKEFKPTIYDPLADRKQDLEKAAGTDQKAPPAPPKKRQ